MPESIVGEVKLVPSITVSIHPTIETPPVKEIDTTQDDVEKALGLKITGGADFNMPITIFHASFSPHSALVRCLARSHAFSRSRMNRKRSELDWSSAIPSSASRTKTPKTWRWRRPTRRCCMQATTSEASNWASSGISLCDILDLSSHPRSKSLFHCCLRHPTQKAFRMMKFPKKFALSKRLSWRVIPKLQGSSLSRTSSRLVKLMFNTWGLLLRWLACI